MLGVKFTSLMCWDGPTDAIALKPQEKDMSKDIIVEFSGWCRVNPENARFQYTGEDEGAKFIISGAEWQSLSEDERSNYILEDVVAAIRDSGDNEWTPIYTFVEAE